MAFLPSLCAFSVTTKRRDRGAMCDMARRQWWCRQAGPNGAAACGPRSGPRPPPTGRLPAWSSPDTLMASFVLRREAGQVDGVPAWAMHSVTSPRGATGDTPGWDVRPMAVEDVEATMAVVEAADAALAEAGLL